MPGYSNFLVRSRCEGSVGRLMPVGELDIATVPVLERAFDEARKREGAEMIVVDLTQLSFMDVSGIHLLERMAVCVEAHQLRIINPSPAVKRLFDITGCRDWLPTIHEPGDPIAAAGAPAITHHARNARLRLTDNATGRGRFDPPTTPACSLP
jgi:anti-sigma B factor antagonist